MTFTSADVENTQTRKRGRKKGSKTVKKKTVDKASWLSTTVRVPVEVDDKTARRLFECMAVGKYAWNWAIAEWQLMEMQKRLGYRDTWPSKEALLEKWHTVQDRCGIPSAAGVAELAIEKFSSMYVVALVVKHKGPVSTTPRLSGSFRIDKSACSLSEDKRTMTVEGVGQMTLEPTESEFSWDEIKYVTVRRYTKKGFVLYLVKSDTSLSADPMALLYASRAEAEYTDDKDVENAEDTGGRKATYGGDRGHDVREELE